MPVKKLQWPLKNTALLIIDAQNFFSPYVKGFKGTVKKIKTLADVAREHEIPVIHSLIVYSANRDKWPELDQLGEYDEELPIEGTARAEEVGELLYPEDHYIERDRFSAFHDTNLGRLLDELGADTLIITGFLTHQCILLTALDAYQRNFRIILPKDAVNSHNKELHNLLLRDFIKKEVGEVNSAAEIVKRLKGHSSETGIEDVEWEV